MALLTADRLTRAFGDRVAVRDVSLHVHGGEVVTLLGPNGAGKTTTMRMLAGLILPSSGRISIDHIEITQDTADDARRSVGILTETPGLWERLTVRTNLLTYARLQGVARPNERVDQILERVELSNRADDAAGTLSKGLKQRVAIARALIHEPPVVLLDEPTSGLDPASAKHMRNLIVELRAEGRAVLVSTHNLAEAEQLSDRIAVLKTALLVCDTPAALRRSKAGVRVVIEVEGAANRWARAIGEGVEASGATLMINLRDISAVPDVVARLASAGARIVCVAPDRRSLEDVYLDLVGAS